MPSDYDDLSQIALEGDLDIGELQARLTRMSEWCRTLNFAWDAEKGHRCGGGMNTVIGTDIRPPAAAQV
jgi:hypothetical protein